MPEINDFDLIAFLDTGTVATRDVRIYIDHESFGAHRTVLADIARLRAEYGEHLPSSGVVDADLEAKAVELEERLRASEIVWTVRAASRDEYQAAFKSVKRPKHPNAPKDKAPQPIVDAYHAKVEEYALAKLEADETFKVTLLAEVVIAVKTPAGCSDGITVDELQSLRSRPHGQQWIDLLWAAFNEASDERAEPPIP